MQQSARPDHVRRRRWTCATAQTSFGANRATALAAPETFAAQPPFLNMLFINSMKAIPARVLEVYSMGLSCDLEVASRFLLH